ncbi:MAG: hypothetical protein COB93_11560 [Sneathiella sp.]|nr:MAG: hypothetical protein COB93_11560 [Sneathiella sp.]
MVKNTKKSKATGEHSLFSRKASLGGDLSDLDATSEDVMTVGDRLRMTREERGLSLHQVAESLRLRALQIQALEDGNFDLLPGQTFVTGFLRSYANLLNLDAVSIVDLYKQEHAGGITTPSLAFPEPNSAGRMPGVGVMMGTMVLALALVAGWLLYQESDSVEFERVAELPDSLTEKVEVALAAEKAKAELVARAAATVTPTAAIAEIAEDEKPLVAGSVETTFQVAKKDELNTEQVSTEPKADLVVADVTPTPEKELASPMVASEVPVVLTEIPKVAPITVAAVPEVVTVETVPSKPAALLTLYPQAVLEKAVIIPDEEPESPLPRTFGVENTNARVVLRANAETWIEVKISDHKPLISRVLKPGDVFMAPDNPEATLTTGNAGGLEIRVDGKRITSLGGTGTIIRDIPLAASSLLDGSTILQ